MKTPGIQFDPEAFVTNAEFLAAHVAGAKRMSLRTTQVRLAKPAPKLSPSQVRAIRNRLKMTQGAFAALLNVPLVTAVSWEKGRRSPSGAALRLLEVAKKHPEILNKAIA
jgi:putative transcriptional regulator